MSKYSKLAAKHLCWYDPASWDYAEVLDSPQPRDEMCACDPCYTGRDAVAVALLELEAERDRLRDRLKALEYWFDTDPEVLEAMDANTLADHNRQLRLIREALEGR
jgi:hypothetical protein